uniref:MIF4G domain-containing protein n=1 Tax=Anopheles atroparvus TaxID=41427 RepID=A0AAG5DDN4_ANOAO
MADQNESSATKKSVKIQDYISPGISRERSFIRNSSQQQMIELNNSNKRRSLAFAQSQAHQHAQQQLREGRLDGLPGMNNKLNVHAQEFQMNNLPLNDHRFPLQSSRSLNIYSGALQHSKSNVTLPMGGMHGRQHHPLQLGSIGSPIQRGSLILPAHGSALHHPAGMPLQQSHMPLVNSPSSSNIILHSSGPRVKFAPEPLVHPTAHANSYQNSNSNTNASSGNTTQLNVAPLQRSKSLSSADTLTRGLASLGLGVGAEANDIGMFPPEVHAAINKAIDDPNQLNARCLMDLAAQLLHRAVDGRRYSLPISRLCISIIAKEKKETFLEALLNTCRQWYQERDKVLGMMQNAKNPSRPRFTSFMAFLTEMFCQLKRRQLQLRTECDGVPPPLLLLTVLGKCCEDCVRPPVRSLSEIECLFFVLTCIGRDLETHLPQQLESLLAGVRDAFLNSAASAPAIRRTLLQLIELQASHWQLPGNTVLYYYPSSK